MGTWFEGWVGLSSAWGRASILFVLLPVSLKSCMARQPTAAGMLLMLHQTLSSDAADTPGGRVRRDLCPNWVHVEALQA